MVDETVAIHDLISLAQASELSNLSEPYLRRLVEKEKLWGLKIGRNWVTTRKAIMDYIRVEHPRGPKPKNLEK